MKPFDLKKHTFLFALSIVTISRDLQRVQNEFVLSKQLLRSGTAIGALIREAQNAESDKDFVHKMAIAQKECDETIYWIELILESKLFEINALSDILSEATELLKIIKTIILNKKQNIKRS